MRQSLAAILAGIIITGASAALGADGPQKSQGAVLRRPQTHTLAERRATPQADSNASYVSEVVAAGFFVEANSCAEYDSSLNFLGADTVGIAILALNADIRQTRVIPFFGVEGAAYMVASGKILQGDTFYPFMDGGSGTVPVLGGQMRLRICNDSPDTIKYTQLTAYASHR
jgi:hypothetical protein